MTNTVNQIPKIIHYCWFGGGSYSPLMEKCMSTWHIYFPDWQIMKWDESNIPHDIPYLNYALEQKLYAFAADYVRFYALEKFGGIYLDTDVEVIRSFDPLLNLDAFAASEHKNDIYINGAIIGGKKGAPLFLELLRKYDEQKIIVFKTLPNVIMEIYKGKPELLTVLPYQSFYPYNLYDQGQDVKQLMYCDINENTYAIHHWHRTWKFSKWQKFLISIKKRILKK